MITNFTIVDTVTGEEFYFGQADEDYLLADDDGIDWGVLESTPQLYEQLNQIGSKISSVKLTNPRYVTIVAWIVDGNKSLIDKQTALNEFLTPFHLYIVYANGYRISGYVNILPKYSISSSENNAAMVKCTFSLICAFPLFYLLKGFSGGYTAGGMIFPWVMNQETGSGFGVYEKLSNVTLQNSGIISIGAIFTFICTGDLSFISVQNKTNGQKFTLNGSFVDGDILKVTTVEGYRNVERFQNGKFVKDFTILSIADSDWIVLEKGQNSFKIQVGGLLTSLGMDISYEPAYFAIEGQ